MTNTCIGKTKRGDRCKRKVANGLSLCPCEHKEIFSPELMCTYMINDTCRCQNRIFEETILCKTHIEIKIHINDDELQITGEYDKSFFTYIFDNGVCCHCRMDKLLTYIESKQDLYDRDKKIFYTFISTNAKQIKNKTKCTHHTGLILNEDTVIDIILNNISHSNSLNTAMHKLIISLYEIDKSSNIIIFHTIKLAKINTKILVSFLDMNYDIFTYALNHCDMLLLYKIMEHIRIMSRAYRIENGDKVHESIKKVFINRLMKCDSFQLKNILDYLLDSQRNS